MLPLAFTSCLALIISAATATLASPIGALDARNNDGTDCSNTTGTLSPAPTGGWQWANNSYIFSFGDSYTDSGMRVTQNSTVRDVDPAFSAEASGPPWISVLASRYNVMATKLYNFAWAGATIDEDLVVPYTAIVQSIKNQVNSFEALFSPAPAEADWDASSSLFSFFIGINDVGNTYDWTNVSLSEFYQKEIDEYHSHLTRLYTLGARNFLLLNVPETSRTPMILEMGEPTVSQVASAVKLFNTILKEMVDTFRGEVADEGYVGWFDDGAVFSNLLDNADTLGFLNVTGYAPYAYNATGFNTQELPGYPVSDYYWRNSYHPTWPIHEILGHAVASFLARKA